jgi:predicted NBD/HSP70 family sugar kinase
LNLSLATVVTILKELVEEGVVEQGEVLASTGGRKPVVFQIVANAKMSLGVALTGHHIRMALVNWKHEVIESYREWITYDNSEAYWRHVYQAVMKLLKKKAITNRNFVGINFVIDGRILPEAGYEDIIPIGIFEGLDVSVVKDMYLCPVYFCSSVKAAAYSNVGRLSSRNTCVYIQFDRTVGGAVISDGTFWGLSNRTGEFGHMYLGENNRKCQCGNYGCLQTYCTSDVIREESGMELDEFFRELEKGNKKLYAVWTRYKKHVIQAVYNLRVIFDIDVMIGGEMAPYLKKCEEELKEILRMLDIYKEQKDYLQFSSGGEFDGAIGAALMVLQTGDDSNKNEFIK